MKTVDFTEIIEACELKVGRWRQLIVFMMMCEYSKVKVISWHWAKAIYIYAK